MYNDVLVVHKVTCVRRDKQIINNYFNQPCPITCKYIMLSARAVLGECGPQVLAIQIKSSEVCTGANVLPVLSTVGLEGIYYRT